MENGVSRSRLDQAEGKLTYWTRLRISRRRSQGWRADTSSYDRLAGEVGRCSVQDSVGLGRKW